MSVTNPPFKGRREDQRLVTGKGRYTADHTMAGEARGHFLRADRAHARIARIDTAAARALKGVLGVLTGEDIVAAGLKSPVPLNFFKGVNGSTLRDPYRPALAHGRVRFVGEPVALVVAETENLAQDAAELIEVEYEDLPVVVGPGQALAEGAALLHDSLPDNLAFEYEYGSRDAAERGFAGAVHVVRVEVTAQRIAGNPMEPKSCVARYDASDDTFEICMPTQGISDLKTALAQITGLDREKFRIRSMDVGGAFGVRNEIYPEFVAVMWAAKQFGRPVKWTGTRSETISGDHHARAAALTGELALDDKGKFLALRVQWLVDVGAYCSGAGALINTVAAPTSSAANIYAVPAIFGSHRLVFTNTTPTTAYRGAGRPNVSYLWERLVEEAARKLGVDQHQAAPAQPSQEGAVSVQDADGLDLRQRRSGGPARSRAEGGGLGRLSRRAAVPPRKWAGCAASAARCSSSLRAAPARKKSASKSRPTVGSCCSRTPARRGRGTRRCFPIWWPTSSGCRPTPSSCATTMQPREGSPAPAASDRVR